MTGPTSQGPADVPHGAPSVGLQPDETRTFQEERDSRRRDAPAELPRIAGYDVLEVLGRGGMGVVYKARQIGLKRLVALKMIRGAGHAGTDEVKRFRAEAESAARLQHPHIVQVYDVGDADGYPFFSLEFIDGGSLAARLKGEPQPPRQAAELLLTLAQAMDYAHGHGVVHRDLKPANVLLASLGRAASEGAGSSAAHTLEAGSATATSVTGVASTGSVRSPRAYGIPKIADFGLAKQLDDDSGQTRSGTVLGTPSYMAPEQALGHTKGIGPAADVYALGAILYEMLTGRPPFKGATMLETLEQVRTQEPVPPTRLQPKVPRDLETICLKCLHKSPAGRYGSAAALAEDLARFVDGRPIAARPVGRVEQTWRWCKRNPWVALWSGVAAAALLIGAIVAMVFAFQANQAAKDAFDAGEEKKKEATKAVTEAANCHPRPAGSRAYPGRAARHERRRRHGQGRFRRRRYLVRRGRSPRPLQPR